MAKAFSVASWNVKYFAHVVAVEHLTFKQFGEKCIDVRRWPQEDTVAKRSAWINAHSDQALPYFEIQMVF